MFFTSKISKKLFRSERAQGLVELAVIAPILIFMFIGLFEVGYALWGYLTLLNIDREAARFSIRPGVLDFTSYDVNEIGYSNVITHAFATSSFAGNVSQLKLQEYLNNTGADEPKAAIIISHLVIDTRKPCDPANQCWAKKTGSNSTPDCSDATLTNPAINYTEDDLVVYPDKPGYGHLRYIYPAAQSANFSSRLNTPELARRLKLENDRFNCNLLSKNPLAPTSKNSAVVVEMFYQQPQLLDFPLMSWILNPVPLYVQTTMRIDSEDRGLCEVYPIAMHISTLNGWTEGGSTIKDIWNGAGKPNPNTSDPNDDFDPDGTSSERGWINWNDDPSADYLEEMLKNPRLATNDYTNPTNPDDHVLNAGDYVASSGGVINSNAIRDALEAMFNQVRGKTIMIPVWDDFIASGTDRYHIIRFATIQVVDYSLPTGSGGYINARLIDADVDGACQ